MKSLASGLQFTATDLATFSSCRHATTLDVGVARRERAKSEWFNPMVAALRERGLEHERRYVDWLRSKSLSVVELPGLKGGTVESTLAAMRAGTQVIVQATVESSPWNGIADVLLRREVPSALAAWSYVPVDTKLATETRAGTVLQLSLYAQLLGDMQGVVPDELCVVVPGASADSFEEIWCRTKDFDAYFRWIRDRMAAAMAEPTRALEAATYPEPVEHCGICKWWEHCDARRRGDDHLSLVAGASRLQRRELEAYDVRTLAALAQVPIPIQWKPKRGSRDSLRRVREQARVQLEGRISNSPVHELLPIEPGQGLTRLPAPSAGDVFFDIEGDPFAANRGREYLFGLAYRNAQDEAVYEAHWASTAAEERAAFEKVVAFFDARRASHPEFHVYHYAPYEPGALKRLMGRYGSCADEVDQLLRDQRFVDLFRIARQSVRASVERYSIKDLEVFYGFARAMDLRVASQSRRVVEQAIEAGDWGSLTAEVKGAVEAYNREDCRSALALRDWLEKLRAQLQQSGTPVPRPEPVIEALNAEATDRVRATHELIAKLVADVPDDPGLRSEDQQARWLLAQELDFHRREDKSEWWEFFRMRELDEGELRDERRALSGLTFKERLPRPKGQRAEIDRYEYPAQDCDIRAGKVLKLAGEGEEFGEVVAIDRFARTVDVKKRLAQTQHHPTAVFEWDMIGSNTLADSLMRFGEWTVENGLPGSGRFGAVRELLLRRAPRLRSGVFGMDGSEEVLAFACRIARDLDHSVLPIQGPPGAGKTYTAARMICALVRDGKKVGVTAISHKVIQKLLQEVCKAAEEQGACVRCLQKVSEVDPHALLSQTIDGKAALRALRQGEADVVGGTAWLWAGKDVEDAVDVLFVDEAGQLALAKTLAVAPAAKSLVLIGDPRQLEQPLKGSHPDGVAVSALEHLFGEHETVPRDRGIFLPETWRLSPSICRFTSDSFYESRLRSRAGLEAQRLTGTSCFDGAGLWYVPVPHDGNQNASPEEVGVVVQVVERLLQSGAAWLDGDGKAEPLRGEHVLVVAPYNAQVVLLGEALAIHGIRVGTVDKFQGQEAPIVIYSMATSTPEEAPRGMGFLYSLNRLNVATSRARCACILVASPRLFEPECRNVEHVRLANAFCRYLELARTAQVASAQTRSSP